MPQEAEVFSFVCNCCGKEHVGIPAYGYDMPVDYFDIPVMDRGKRAVLGTDTCVIDRERYYIKGILDIPIVGYDEPITWGLWAKVTEADYAQYRKLLGLDGSAFQATGKIDVTMPGYNELDKAGQTYALRCDLVGQPVGLRPRILLHPVSHRLFVDCSLGVSPERASELIAFMPH
ncbi:DUF2199 domain-containing protein [Roseibium aggregatum]|uniref:DUF2199 domain-containing protein n=1 Tax=Roseibium aggregatum TaxID=187304 RepID=A0A939EGS6_9HYPH|nr:DUF2199 domain-containing protein [Roseibium aggregatum]MBN9672187.1 DUF2199 domain-containing protein [Roseibium aggregatum]